MSKIKTLSIDLAKNVFQLCGLNQAGQPVINKRVNRGRLVSTVVQLNPEVIVMEACYSTNYWGRVFQSHGFTVRAIPAQHVKAFVRGNKNDGNDALAIAEASARPNMRFVPIKTIEQQDLQALHRIRERHIRGRTALVNQLRGLLSEYGVIVTTGWRTLVKQLPEIIEDADNGLSPTARAYVRGLADELSALSATIKHDSDTLERLSQTHEAYHRLMTIPGVGKILSSTIIAAVGTGQSFGSAREFAAWVGLTPKQYASGDKSYLAGISKRGNPTLRRLFIHGARAAFTRTHKRDTQLFKWADKLVARGNKPKTWVALANKMARIAWAILQHHTEFDYRYRSNEQAA